MIILHQFASSPFTEKVTRILTYKNLDYQVEEINRLKAKKYSHVSPFGKFPALLIDNQPVCDSTDIAYELDRRFPEKKIIPDDPEQRSLVHIIEDWADESLYFYEMTMRISWENNARSTLRKIKHTLPPLPEWFLVKLMLKKSGELTRAQGLGRKTKQQIIADAERHFAAINARLENSDWLVGTTPTLADFAVIGQLNCILDAEEAQVIVKNYPKITQWIDRLNSVAPYPQAQSNHAVNLEGAS